MRLCNDRPCDGGHGGRRRCLLNAPSSPPRGGAYMLETMMFIRRFGGIFLAALIAAFFPHPRPEHSVFYLDGGPRWN